MLSYPFQLPIFLNLLIRKIAIQGGNEWYAEKRKAEFIFRIKPFRSFAKYFFPFYTMITFVVSSYLATLLIIVHFPCSTSQMCHKCPLSYLFHAYFVSVADSSHKHFKSCKLKKNQWWHICSVHNIWRQQSEMAIWKFWKINHHNIYYRTVSFINIIIIVIDITIGILLL